MYTKLDKSPAADVDLNYEISQSEIGKAIRKHIPNKLVKYDKHKQNKWTTIGINIDIYNQ